MGEIRQHIPVKLFTAISYGKGIAVSFLFDKLENLFSKIDSKSDIFLVDDFTAYYQKEMGEHINKIIVSYRQLIRPEELPEIKAACNRLEMEFAENGKRKVNIDPGYLTQAKMILATTKDYSHRVYLSQGIYADLHLVRASKSYRIQPWTYPDYAQETIIEYFNKLRGIYLNDLSRKTGKR